MDFTNTVIIGRPPHDVFEFLADFENVPKWNYAIEETHRTLDGPVGVGPTYAQTRSIPIRTQEAFAVVEYERDRSLAIRGSIGPFEGTLTYNLEPVGDGTKLTNRADLAAHGLQRILAPVLQARVREAVAANLTKLKELLEQ